MPYIIETRIDDPRQRLCGCGAHHDSCDMGGARVAVATLDEAREAVQRVLAPFDADALPAPDDEDLNDYSRAYFSACADMEVMEESGSTVGPLPDGTVIEVRPTSWMDLKIHTDLPGDPHGLLSDSAILAAFNAA